MAFFMLGQMALCLTIQRSKPEWVDAEYGRRLQLLRKYLAAHKVRCSWTEGLVFGRSPGVPFNHSSVLRRAAAAWKASTMKKSVTKATALAAPRSLSTA